MFIVFMGENMSDTMLLGVLRIPPHLWSNGPIDVQQRHSRYLEAADRIEELQQFIKNGVEFGYIAIPDKGDPARRVIDEVLNR
jgi:hypothetical protein